MKRLECHLNDRHVAGGVFLTPGVVVYGAICCVAWLLSL